MLIVIWYWLSTQSDCEWDSSTTNFTRHLMRDKKQNWFFVADLMTWDLTIMGKAKRCVYGLGFGRKRPNPRPSPNKFLLVWCFKMIYSIHNISLTLNVRLNKVPNIFWFPGTCVKEIQKYILLILKLRSLGNDEKFSFHIIYLRSSYWTLKGFEEY